jgi:hypothetical protein
MQYRRCTCAGVQAVPPAQPSLLSDALHADDSTSELLSSRVTIISIESK